LWHVEQTRPLCPAGAVWQREQLMATVCGQLVFANGTSGPWQPLQTVRYRCEAAGGSWHVTQSGRAVFAGWVNTHVVPGSWHWVQAPRSAWVVLWHDSQAVESGCTNANGLGSGSALWHT
jgi:hypothetical protein